LPRNLKQSATVFAAENTRRGTPYSRCVSTPAASGASERRTTRTGGRSTAGVRAFRLTAQRADPQPRAGCSHLTAPQSPATSLRGTSRGVP
jgi:hypothetical protein